MFIKKIHIEKFRGFHDVSLELGKNITVIAGQNGTQKTTLLGILSQPFTITDKNNPLYGEKPLCGGNYKSSFSDKFKLSDNFDKPNEHEWTLYLDSEEDPEFTVTSIKRSDGGLRFWRKGDKSKGSGYIQLPVIYLSLSRLFPIGEDIGINSSSEIHLTNTEFDFYQKWHNKILCIQNDKIEQVDYLSSKQKNTLGVTTNLYDWKMNSAGQDNIGKILLAILSFKRLQKKYSNDYEGGILVIDELDATLYPAAQLKLLEAFRKFSSEYKIQIVLTTHSLSILRKACEFQEDLSIPNQIKVIYLHKYDNSIRSIKNITFSDIWNKLNVTLSPKNLVTKKIIIFTEDKEAILFTKALLKRKATILNFVDCTFGCSNLIELAQKKVPGYKYLESIIFLDGDVKTDVKLKERVKQLKNILILPGSKSVEKELADYLYNLSDDSPVWNGIYEGYTKQFVFKDVDYEEIQAHREKAKSWFNSQKQYWGVGCRKLINYWIKDNQDEVVEFIKQYDELTESYKTRLI